jgi:hypothetical protein
MAIYGKVKLVVDNEQDRPINLYKKSISPLIQEIIIPANTKSIEVDITSLNDWRNFWTQYGTNSGVLQEDLPLIQNNINPLHLSLPSKTLKKSCCGGREVAVEEYFNVYWKITQINSL